MNTKTAETSETNSPEEKPEFITASEAAEMLQVTTVSVRKWVRSGSLYGYKINPDNRSSPYKIELASVEAFMERRRTQFLREKK